MSVGGRCQHVCVSSDVLDLDATAVLSAAEDLTREQRERELDVLRLVLRGRTCTLMARVRVGCWARTS